VLFDHVLVWLIWIPLLAAFVADALWTRSRRSSAANVAAFGPSARIDLAYWAFYTLGRGGLLAVITPIGLVEHFVRPHLPRLADPVSLLPHHRGVATVGVALVALVAVDLVQYWTHRWMHRSPFFWHFHAPHHAAEEMTLFTGLRITLTERALSDLCGAVVLVLLGLRVESIIIVLYVRRFIDILQHSNLSWTYGPLGYVVASPVNHRFHHALDERDWGSNYGNILSLWDHLFGSANGRNADHRRRLTIDTLPEIGVDEREWVATRGPLALPVLQDLHIWWSLLTRRRARSTAMAAPARAVDDRHDTPP
jgi:sterol desaturase/sphingolipid hydroxylase (fatty acid hydroxylase superfamily)